MMGPGKTDGDTKTHGEAHAEAVFGFLEGRMQSASQAMTLATQCKQCFENVRFQSDLVASFQAVKGPPARENCLDPMRIAEMTPVQAAADPHLRVCLSCRLEWLLAHAEYPEEAQEPAPARSEARWVERVLGVLSGWLRPQVLVPAAASIAVLAVVGWLFFREPPVFPYDAWSGDAKVLDQMLPKGLPDGLSFSGTPRGLSFDGGRTVPPDLSSFRVGFAAGLVRDLYRQGRDSDALRTYRLVVEGGGLKLDPALAAEFVRETLDPCALPGVPDPELCRLGIVAYGVVRTGLSQGWAQVDVPLSLRETVVRLHSRLPAGAPEARGVRAAPPGTPEAFGGILLDLIRF